MEQSALEQRRRAASVRRGVMGLARRLRTQRTGAALSASKLIVIGWLHRSGGMTATEIAAAEHMRPQSLTRLLAELDAGGLIRRHTGETDRRQVMIELTPAGFDALAQDMARRDAWLAQAMEQALSPTEQGLLLLAAQLMERLAGIEEFRQDIADMESQHD